MQDNITTVQGVMMVSKELATALRLAHKANADHYRRLLNTELADTLRTFVERRLAEEQAALEQLSETAAPMSTPVDAA